MDNKTFLRGTEKAIDLGCGSGVLSFILTEAQPATKIISIDKNEDAVRSTGMSASILNLQDRIKNEIFDFVEKQKQGKPEFLLEELKKEK